MCVCVCVFVMCGVCVCGVCGVCVVCVVCECGMCVCVCEHVVNILQILFFLAYIFVVDSLVVVTCYVNC